MVVAVLLAGCSTVSEPDPTPSADGSQGSGGSGPHSPSPGQEEQVAADFVTVSAPFGAAQMEYEVGPLIDLGEASLLRVKFVNRSETPGHETTVMPLEFRDPWDNRFTAGRLVDIESGTVELAGRIDDQVVGSGGSDLTVVSAGEEREVFTAYGPQSRRTVDVVLPYMGPVLDVPVVPVEQTADRFSETVEKFIPDPARVEPQVFDLESYSLGLTGEVDSVRTDETVHVNVAADVLFAVDEWALSTAADSALTKAARQIDRSGVGSGELLVVGHTDDVGSRAHNQKLSERRAASVAERMEGLADLRGYDVKVVGKAFDEPRAEGTTKEARAQNRRVELVFKPGGTTTVEKQEVELPIPDSDGPTGTGTDGVVIEFGQAGTARVSLDRVIRRGPYLFGQLGVTGVSGEIAAPGIHLATKPGSDVRGNYNVQQTGSPVLLALLADEQWNYPLDFKQRSAYETLTQPLFGAGLEAGTSYTLPVVWPDVSAGAATVTMDVALPPNSSLRDAVGDAHPPFRLTEIAVVDG